MAQSRNYPPSIDDKIFQKPELPNLNINMQQWRKMSQFGFDKDI